MLRGDRSSRVLTAVVLLGLGLRGWHFFRSPSLWHDEAALIVNVLRLDVGEMFGQLLYHEAAPPLFLAAEKTVVALLGDGLFSLRLVPFVAGCAALLLFVPVARSLLPAAAVPWAVFLLATSEKLLWHTCEAKPYSVDVLVAVLLLAVCCRGGPSPRRLLLLAVLSPLLIWLSFPACFLLGGVLVALLPGVVRRRTWPAYGALALAVLGSFAALALGPARAQADGAMRGCWLDHFPDWDSPSSVPGWALSSTLGIFQYAFRPLGTLLVPLALAGAWSLWRGRSSALVLLLLPVGLALVAALLGQYPYGGARVLVYAVPGLALLTAAGLPRLLAHGHTASLVAGTLLLLPGIEAGRSVVRDGGRADGEAASAWVEAQRRPSDLVCGNDWTHHYHFRHLGPLFRDRPREANRVWLVFAGRYAPDALFELARSWLPPSYRVLQRRDFRNTTVLLAARRER